MVDLSKLFFKISLTDLTTIGKALGQLTKTARSLG